MKKIVFILILMVLSIVINVYCFSTRDTGPKGVDERKDLMQQATTEETQYIKKASEQIIGKLKSGNYQSIVDTLAPDLTRYQIDALENKLERNCGKDICVTCVRTGKRKKCGMWEAECKASGGDTIYLKFNICKCQLRLCNVY